MTTTISPNTTLAELVTAHPPAARVLERRGLDYCCGGHETLDAACARVGLDLADVVLDLQAGSDDEVDAGWATMTSVELVEHIESTHHRYLWDEMPRLTALIAKLADVHGTRHPELSAIGECWASICADLEPHLLKEERVLFPMIRQLEVADTVPAFHCGSIENPVTMMMQEHDHLGELLVELNTLTDGYSAPADGCASYRACFAGLAHLEADTHLHIHKENNLLFPLVVALERRLIERVKS